MRVTAGQPTVSTRSYFSSYQLWAAENSAGRGAEIEAAHSGDRTRFEIEHRANVLGAITMSVGFLEAMVGTGVYDTKVVGGRKKATTISSAPPTLLFSIDLERAVRRRRRGPRHRERRRHRPAVRAYAGAHRHMVEADRRRPRALLEKCQLLLSADQPLLDTGGQPYQDVRRCLSASGT